MFKKIALALALAFPFTALVAAPTKEVEPTVINSKTFNPLKEKVFKPKAFTTTSGLSILVVEEEFGRTLVEASITDPISVRSDVTVDESLRFDMLTESTLMAKHILKSVYGIEGDNIAIGNVFSGEFQENDGSVSVTEVIFKRNNVVHHGRITFVVSDSAGSWFMVYPVDDTLPRYF